MKTVQRFAWAVLAQVSLLPISASAATIVDTGPAAFIGPQDFGLAVTNGSISGSLQYLAGEFTTTRAYDITSLSAFVNQYTLCFECTTPLTATFHLGLATGPANPSAATFTDLLSLPVSFISTNDAPSGWATATVANYLLPAGTYWIVASATATDSPLGLGMPGGVSNPLAQYAIDDVAANNWNVLTQFGVTIPPTLGFQVDGNPVGTVPLPGALGLLASGLAALVTLSRSRARAT